MFFIDPSAFMQVTATNFQTIKNYQNAQMIGGQLRSLQMENGRLRQQQEQQLMEQNAQISVLAKEFEALRKEGKDLPCPYCAQLISKDALVCNYCQGALTVGDWEYLKVALRAKPYLAAKDPNSIKELMQEITRIDEEQRALVALFEIAKQQEADLQRKKEAVATYIAAAESVISQAQLILNKKSNIKINSSTKDVNQLEYLVTQLTNTISNSLDSKEIQIKTKELSDVLPKYHKLAKSKQELEAEKESKAEIHRLLQAKIDSARKFTDKKTYLNVSEVTELKRKLQQIIEAARKAFQEEDFELVTKLSLEINLSTEQLSGVVKNLEEKDRLEKQEKATQQIESETSRALDFVVGLANLESTLKSKIGVFGANKLKRHDNFDLDNFHREFESLRRSYRFDVEIVAENDSTTFFSIRDRLISIGTLIGFRYILNDGNPVEGLRYLQVAQEMGDAEGTLSLAHLYLVSGDPGSTKKVLRPLHSYLFEIHADNSDFQYSRDAWILWNSCAEFCSKKRSKESDLVLLSGVQNSLKNVAIYQPEKRLERIGYFGTEVFLLLLAATIARGIGELELSSELLNRIEKKEKKNIIKYLEYMSELAIGQGKYLYKQLLETFA